MPQCCAVPMCSDKKGGHKFPLDKEMLQKWIVAIRRDKFHPSKHSSVCKNHFNPEDYEMPKDSMMSNPRPRLKKDAVPSKFNWTENPGVTARQRRTRVIKHFRIKEPLEMETSEAVLSLSPKQICATCLSSDRTTRRMDSASLNVANTMGLYDGAREDATLCWECEAFLRRCLRFRRRAEAAHATLRQYAADRNEPTIICLSSLKTTVNTGYDVIVESEDDRSQRPNHTNVEIDAKISVEINPYGLYDEVPIKNEPDLYSDVEFAEDPLKPTAMRFEQDDKTTSRPVEPRIITEQTKTTTKSSAQVALITKNITKLPQSNPKYWMQIKTGNETKNVPILDPAVLKQLESLPKVVTPVKLNLATPVKMRGQNSTVTVKAEAEQNAMGPVRTVVQKSSVPANVIAMTKMTLSKSVATTSLSVEKKGPSRLQLKQNKTPVVIKASSQVNFADLSKILKEKKSLLNQKQNIVLITKVPGKNQQPVKVTSDEGSNIGAVRTPAESASRTSATHTAPTRRGAAAIPTKVQVSPCGVLKPQPSGAAVNKRSGADTASPEQAVRLIQISEESLQEQLELQRASPFYVNSRFKCELCIMGYYTRWQLEEHQRHKHVAKPGHLQCSVCTSYIPEISLDAHERLHRAMFVCVACGFNSRESRRVWQHVRTHGPQPPPKPDNLPCSDCGKLFPSKNRLRYHKLRHHADPVTCHNCGKSISSEIALKAHLRLCESERELLQCPHCDKKYLGPNNLRAHVRSHTHPPDESAVKCVECDALFASEHNYRQHLKYSMKHAAEERMLKCSECDKKFAVKANLRTHYRYHHLRATGHVCRVCDKMFATARSLRLHTMYVHERVAKPKDCMCEVCGKSFGATALRHHMAVHSSARPYVCRVCGDTFRQGAALYTHTKLKHLKQKRKPSAKKAAPAADT